MDLDFDDQPTNHAAEAARAGARFKPKGKPQPKKKQISLSTSQTTLSTDVAKEQLSTQTDNLKSQTDAPASLDESSAYPSKASTSGTIESENVTINQCTFETFSEENADTLSRGISWSTEPSFIRACTNVDLEGKRCDDVGIDAAPLFPDDPKEQHSAMFGDFVAPGTDEDIHAQTERIQAENESCHLDMETLDIVQEEGITSSYEQYTGKFQPKPRLLDTVTEEHESYYSVDGTSYCSMGTNESEFMVNEETRNDFNTNTSFYGELQEEELNIPEVPTEAVPEMEAQNAYGGWEQEEQVVSPSTTSTVIGAEEHCLGNTVEEEGPEKGAKMGKSKKATARKRKKTSEGEPNNCSENPQKKFKHSSRRQRRTLAKELLETPDDEIRFLPIRDMLRLVEYKEWVEKKEAKGAVVQPIQESSNMNTSNMQYGSHGFYAEDEFGVEENENQETNVVKPDSPVNYQTYMTKSSRIRWSKEDTELFYEGIREFGSNLSMVQQLFPNRTRNQIKLKFKLEERRYPLKLNEALSNRSKHLTHFHNVIKRLQQEAAAAKEGLEEEEEEEAGGETTTDVQENEEQTETEQRADDAVAKVKESDGEDVENVVRTDDGDECDDDDFWNSYKSEL